jgi:hypothetical protein
MRTIVRYTRRPQGIYGQLNHLHDQAGSALSRRDRIMRGKNTRLLNRREFSGLCAALGSFASGALLLQLLTAASGTSRNSGDVRFESAKRAMADIDRKSQMTEAER